MRTNVYQVTALEDQGLLVHRGQQFRQQLTRVGTTSFHRVKLRLSHRRPNTCLLIEYYDTVNENKIWA